MNLWECSSRWPRSIAVCLARMSVLGFVLGALSACSLLDPLKSERRDLAVQGNQKVASAENRSQDYLYAQASAAILGQSPLALAESRANAEQVARLELMRSEMSVNNPRSYHSALEKTVREAVSAKLSPWQWPESEFETWKVEPTSDSLRVTLRVSKQSLLDELEARMQQIETHLLVYRHVGDRGSHLRQLEVLLPALTWIEEHQRLSALQKRLQNEELPFQVEEAGVVALLDRKISILFNELLWVVNESLPESAAYENILTESLRREGLRVSAKQPDLDVNYYIEPTEYNEDSGQATLFADMTLLDSDKEVFLSYATEISGQPAWSDEDLKQAVQKLAGEVYQLVGERLLEWVYVNEHQLASQIQ